MKQNRLYIQCLKGALAVMLLFGYSWASYAKDQGCWADFYENVQYKGKHIRIKGPAERKDLVNIQGKNWDSRIQSLVVGPKANVTVFEHKNFKLILTEMANHPDQMKSLGISRQDILEDSELIFKAGSKIHNLKDFGFNLKIRSLKIGCVK